MIKPNYGQILNLFLQYRLFPLFFKYNYFKSSELKIKTLKISASNKPKPSSTTK